MRLFKHKSSHPSPMFSLTNNKTKTVGSIDEIVKKLRQSLNKYSIDSYNNDEQNKSFNETNKKLENNDKSNINAETLNEIHIKQYLENLKFNIFINNNNYLDINNDNKQNTCNSVNNMRANHNSKMFSSKFSEQLFSSNILIELIYKLPEIGFENKKLITSIVCNALLLKIEERLVTV